MDYPTCSMGPWIGADSGICLPGSGKPWSIDIVRRPYVTIAFVSFPERISGLGTIPDV